MVAGLPMLESSNERGAERRICHACLRPVSHCLCAAITRIENRTEVVIVQHPREHRHPFGTARMVELSLARVRLLVDHVGRLRRDPKPLAPLDGAALLYPHPSARDVTTLAPDERPRRLVVIDGTWHHARTLYRDVPGLADLPHVTLPARLSSGFRIRRQPRGECLSTLEAVAHALEALEPETRAVERLVRAFHHMQDRQLELPRDQGRSRRRRRPAASRAIPRALSENLDSLVVVYAESVRSEDRKGDLLSCTALHLESGERFFGVVARPGLSDAHLAHLGHARAEVESGMSLETLRQAWRGFLPKGATLASWNRSTLRLLEASGLGAPNAISLKGAYHNLKRTRGSLESIIAAEGLGGGSSRARPRALGRLDNAVRLARFLHRAASG